VIGGAALQTVHNASISFLLDSPTQPNDLPTANAQLCGRLMLAQMAFQDFMNNFQPVNVSHRNVHPFCFISHRPLRFGNDFTLRCDISKKRNCDILKKFRQPVKYHVAKKLKLDYLEK